jgi:hypothetical protein
MATETSTWVYGARSSFAAGELTPTIEGRVDLPLYQNGAKKIINWMILPSGSLTRRPGTDFIWSKGKEDTDAPTPLKLFDYAILDKEDALYAERQKEGGEARDEEGDEEGDGQGGGNGQRQENEGQDGQ